MIRATNNFWDTPAYLRRPVLNSLKTAGAMTSVRGSPSSPKECPPSFFFNHGVRILLDKKLKPGQWYILNGKAL